MTDNPAFWIAVGAAVLVILAHVALLWWFVIRKSGKDE